MVSRNHKNGEPDGLAKKQVAFRFADIRLLECHSQQAIKEGPLPTNSEIQVDVGLAVHKSELHSLVRPKVTLSVWYDDASDKTPAISVSVTFQLHYQYSKRPPSTKQLRQVLTQIALLHSWPYFREIIQSQINRMGLPPVLLPLLAMPTAPANKKSKKGKRNP
jgi:preprotein translocase subunit SecB